MHLSVLLSLAFSALMLVGCM